MIDYSFKEGRTLVLRYLRTKDTSTFFINIGQGSMRFCYKNIWPVRANGVGNGGLYTEQKADISGSKKLK
jgi:hypothetical protein